MLVGVAVPHSPPPGRRRRAASVSPEVPRAVSEPRRATSPFRPHSQGRWQRLLRRLPVVLAVSAGGVLGGSARYGVDLLVPTGNAGFPWPTFTANIIGAFWLALLLVLVVEVWRPARYVRPFLAVGLLGSFTTFSTWMVEFDLLLADGAALLAGAYLVSTVLAGLAATSLGLVIGRGATAQLTRRSRKGH